MPDKLMRLWRHDHRQAHRPVRLAIAGDSAADKTTLTRGIAEGVPCDPAPIRQVRAGGTVTGRQTLVSRVQLPVLLAGPVDLLLTMNHRTVPLSLVEDVTTQNTSKASTCGPAQAQPIASAVTGSQLVMLADCGHIPSIEAPQEYRHTVVEFLRH